MKKFILSLFAFAVCGAVFLTGCEGSTQEKTEGSAKTDETKVESVENETVGTAIEEKIVGSWIVEDRNDQPALTNEKGVFTFVSPTKAYISAAYNSHSELGKEWIHQLQADVSIDGSKVTLTWSTNENTIMVDELSVSVITDTEQQGNLIVKSIEDGKETIVMEEPMRLVKVSKDFSGDILGTWEGRCTGEGSVFDDGQEHRWEYNDNGTYIYYVKDDDSWEVSDDTLSEYFVAGNLLYTRWMEDGIENREQWEIFIDGDKMSWTALREGDDGKAFTATFEMNKVKTD